MSRAAITANTEQLECSKTSMCILTTETDVATMLHKAGSSPRTSKMHVFKCVRCLISECCAAEACSGACSVVHVLWCMICGACTTRKLVIKVNKYVFYILYLNNNDIITIELDIRKKRRHHYYLST